MKNNGFLNKILPHALAIIGFMIISLIFNYPEIEGQILFQNDVLQAEGAAKELKDFEEKEGRLALWTNAMFSGMPAVMIYTDFPTSIGTQLGRVFTSIMPFATNLLFLNLLGFYIMMVMLGYNIWVSVFGSLALAFSSYNVINIEAGHVSKCLAIAFAPPLIGSVILAYRGKYLLGGVLAGLFTSLELYANHVQITYYIFLSLALYALYLLIRIFLDKEAFAEKMRSFGIASGVLVLGGLLGLASHTARLWTVYEFSKETIRGKSELSSNDQSNGGLDRDYAFGWSYGISESFTFLIPNFYGSGSGAGAKFLDENSASYRALRNNNLNPQFMASLPIYWGNQPFTGGPAYFGAIVCFLFVFGLFMSRDPLKWWLLAVTVLFVMISWGKNLSWFNYFLFDYFPLFNKFRAVTMILSVVQIYVVWMGVLGLEALASPEKNYDRAFTSLKFSGGIMGGLLLFIALLGSSFQKFEPASQEVQDAEGNTVSINKDEQFVASLSRQLESTGRGQDIAYDIIEGVQDDRAALQRADTWRSFVFIALVAVLIWLLTIEKLQISYVLGGIALLSLIDLWIVDRRYLSQENFERPRRSRSVVRPTFADNQIMASQDLHFRVLNANKDVFNDATTSYFHHSVGGYHGAKLRRYKELIDAHLSQNNRGVYDMLNTKYFIQRNQQGTEEARINPGAKGNAWFVKQFKLVKNADEELASLQGFNPSDTAFIDERFKNQVANLKIKPDAKATIKLTSYEPDRLVYESNAASPQLAVFSEIYYVNPGNLEWKALIDGKEVEHLRANYVLRALVIPEGKHTIEFKFDIPIYYTGKTVSLIASIVLLAFLGFVIFLAYKEQSTQAKST